MGMFTYFPNIPFANNNPSVDQPNMETDTNSISSLIAIDHQGFNLNQGGYHTVVHFIDNVVDPPAVPPAGPLLGAGELYFKTLTSVVSDTALFSQTAGGLKAQLTCNISPSVMVDGFGSTFGTTFLPGGLLLNYGIFNRSSSHAVNFLTPFSSPPYSITATPFGTLNSNSAYLSLTILSFTKTAYTWQIGGNNSAFNNFFWQAIGPS